MTGVRSFALSIAALAVASACESKPVTSPTAEPDPVAPAAAGQSATELPDPLPDRDSALAHRLVNEHGALLLDVRSAQEFGEGHIDGAQHIPHTALQSQLDKVSEMTGGDKSKPVVVYCKSGRRAGIAKDILTEAGYERVTNLGGMSDW